MTTHEIEVGKLAVSILVFVGAIIPAVMAVRTYRRTDAWKRAEFLAREMKEFFNDPRVQSAFILIDWGSRDVLLLDPTSENGGKVHVDREVQVKALLPHTLLNVMDRMEEARSSPILRESRTVYSNEQAAIRDRYDAFLDGLERFSSYAQTRLVAVSELRPYLGYWIDSIHSSTRDPDDAAWSATLLTYIHFYGYAGVQWLFREFGRPINPGGSAHTGFLRAMSDQVLASELSKAARARQGIAGGVA